MPERVRITWKNPEHDWPYFYIISTKGEFLKLKGADYPDGTCKHAGDVFWVHQSEIVEMAVIGK